MSERELLNAIEEDVKKECASILENARKEAESIVSKALQETEELRRKGLEEAKASVQKERVRKLVGARMHANEIILRERHAGIEKVLNKVRDRFKELPIDKGYPEILKNLLKEAMAEWDRCRKGEVPLILAAMDEIQFLNTPLAPFEIIPDEKGRVSRGVVLMSADKRFKIVNTLSSRLEKAMPELTPIIDRELYGHKLS